MGTVSMVIKLINFGPTCTIGGWPSFIADPSHAGQATIEHVLDGPALAQQPVGPAHFDLVNNAAAYVVVSGTDMPSTDRCSPPYFGFVMRLHTGDDPIKIFARVPRMANSFPDCGPLQLTPLLPAIDVIPQFR